MRFATYVIALAILEHTNKIEKIGIILVVLGVILLSMDAFEFLKKMDWI